MTGGKNKNQSSVELFLFEVFQHRKHCKRTVFLNAVRAVRMRVYQYRLGFVFTGQNAVECFGTATVFLFGFDRQCRLHVSFRSRNHRLTVRSVYPNAGQSLIIEYKGEILSLYHVVAHAVPYANDGFAAGCLCVLQKREIYKRGRNGAVVFFGNGSAFRKTVSYMKRYRAGQEVHFIDFYYRNFSGKSEEAETLVCNQRKLGCYAVFIGFSRIRENGGDMNIVVTGFVMDNK